MTTHLSSQEFIDAIDQVLPAARSQHLDACVACREEIEALRAVLGDVHQDSRVPEPSPLFWDHFPLRVHAAVQAERAAPARASWWAIFQPWRTALAAAVTVAAVVVGVSLHRSGLTETVSPVWSDAGEADPTVLADGSMALDGVEWDFVSSVMGDLGQDDAREVLAPTRHAMDAAFEGLTAAEREAFVKLLKAEMVAGTE